jgi:hypothetical protein
MSGKYFWDWYENQLVIFTIDGNGKQLGIAVIIIERVEPNLDDIDDATIVEDRPIDVFAKALHPDVEVKQSVSRINMNDDRNFELDLRFKEEKLNLRIDYDEYMNGINPTYIACRGKPMQIAKCRLSNVFDKTYAASKVHEIHRRVNEIYAKLFRKETMGERRKKELDKFVAEMQANE